MKNPNKLKQIIALTLVLAIGGASELADRLGIGDLFNRTLTTIYPKIPEIEAMREDIGVDLANDEALFELLISEINSVESTLVDTENKKTEEQYSEKDKEIQLSKAQEIYFNKLNSEYPIIMSIEQFRSEFNGIPFDEETYASVFDMIVRDVQNSGFNKPEDVFEFAFPLVSNRDVELNVRPEIDKFLKDIFKYANDAAITITDSEQEALDSANTIIDSLNNQSITTDNDSNIDITSTPQC